MVKILVLNKIKDFVMKKVSVFFIICICLQSCTDFSQKVEIYVSEKYGDTDSTSVYEVDLQDILGAKISEVYVFGEVTSNEEISEIIGIALPHRKISMSWNTKYWIICVFDKQVTYKELYEKRNVSFAGNDTIWHFSKKCQGLYSQFHPGMTVATWCDYQVFHSPKMKIKREPLSNSERTRYRYELSSGK